MTSVERFLLFSDEINFFYRDKLAFLRCASPLCGCIPIFFIASMPQNVSLEVCISLFVVFFPSQLSYFNFNFSRWDTGIFFSRLQCRRLAGQLLKNIPNCTLYSHHIPCHITHYVTLPQKLRCSNLPLDTGVC